MSKVIKAALIAAAIVFTAGAAAGVTIGGFGMLTTAAGALTATGMAVLTFTTQLLGGLIGGMGSKGGNAGGGNFGSKFAARAAIAPRQIIYGQCRVGGTYVHMSTSGTDNHRFHGVIVLSGHEIEELVSVKLNDTVLTTSTTTENSTTVFKVTNTKFRNSDNDNAFDNSGTLIKFTFEDGSQTSANQFMVSNVSSIGNNHIGKDCAFVYITMIFDAEVFGGGVPQLSFEVKGKKVFDPRNNQTAYSTNPALCIRDYISNTVYGLKAPNAEINDATTAGGFAAAANVCDQTVNLAPSGSETRYTANGFTNFSADGGAVLESLLSTCAGQISYTNGKFNIFAGASQTPSLTITDDHLLDQVQLVTNPQSGELFNSVKPIHIDKDNGYNSIDGLVFEDTTLLANDTPTGESSANYKKLLEVQLPFTTSKTEAQRLAKIALLSSRQVKTVSLFTSLKFFRLQPNDWVYVTNERLGFNQKVFEVLSTNVEINTSGDSIIVGNRLQLKEVEAAVFNYATSEYQDPVDEGGSDDGGDYSVSTPTGLALTQLSFVEGATFKADIQANWTNIANDAIVGTEVAYKLSTETEYSGDIVVGKGVSSARIPNVVVGKTYNVKVKHIDLNGVSSAYSSAVNISISDPSSIAAPTNFAATSNRVGILLSWTNPSNTNLRAIKVYRKTTDSEPTNENSLVHTMIGEPNATSRFYQGQMDGLTAGVTYYFWVRAITHNGTQSAFSSSVNGSYSVYDKADINLSNVEDKSSADIRGEIVEADLVGSGNAFSVKPNKTEVADTSTEGIFSITLDEGSATNVNVFSSAERTKLDRLRLGKDPSDATKSILNDNISISKVSGAVRLTGGSGSSSDVSFDNSDVGLGNVTNDAQIKTDGSNAPNILKNDQITLSKSGSGALSLSGGGAGSVSFAKGDVGLGNVINAAQVRADLSGAPAGILNSNVDADHVGLGNVTNESKATMFADPTFTGTVAGVSKSMVGLGNVTNDAQVKDDLSNLTLNSSDLEVSGGSLQAKNALKNSQVTLAKSEAGVLSLTNGNAATVSFDNSDVGLGNVTNDAQIKTDGSNAPNSLKNNQITISKSGSGALSLSGGGSGSVSLDNTDVGLSNVTNHAQVKDDLSNLTLNSTDLEVSSGTLQAKNALKNSQISISAGGVLSNAGGGTVTATGLGAVKTDLTNAPNAIKNDQVTLSKDSDGNISLDNAGSGSIFLSKADVGLGNVGNVSVANIRSGTTATDVGLGNVTNDAQVKLDLTNAPNAIKNNQITLSLSGTSIGLNNAGSGTQTLSKTNVGLSDLDSLESGTGTKLAGIEAGATVGAKLDDNLVDENNNDLASADVVTSQGTSNDTNNVNSVAKADITGGITGTQTNVANVIQNLAAGTQNINAGALNAGSINTSLLKLQELFLPTEGTATAGQTVSIFSTMTQVSLGSIGDGAGFYMGTVSFDITDAQNDDIRGASIHIDLKSGSTVVYTKYFPIGIKEGNQYYDAGDQFGDTNDLPVMHLEFAYFHTSNTALNLFINADSNDTVTTCLVKARAVRFGAETVTFNPTSISAVTGATASSTQDSGTVTVSGFSGSKQVNLTGNSTALVSINGGTFVNAASAGTITANQTFEIRLTASATAGTTRSATVEIGGTAITFSVTTAGTYTPTYSGGGGSGSAGGGFENTTQLN